MSRFEFIDDWVALRRADCVEGAREFLADGSVDLIITDPPYGIDGGALHKHYHRDESFVVDGYVEVAAGEYAEFSRRWVAEAARVLRPGGAIYLVSGYTHLREILNALAETDLVEVNHLIWKYNFGVYTKKKWVSSHYHILYCVKPGAEPTFNTHCRFGPQEKGPDGEALNYRDREDVLVINREYKPGREKNKNELPTALLTRLIQYSSDEGDTVCDFFLGGGSTAAVARGLRRKAVGFELSEKMFASVARKFARGEAGEPGALLAEAPRPKSAAPVSQGQRWTPEAKAAARQRYRELKAEGLTQKVAIASLQEELGRGYFSILNVVK